MIVHLIDDSSGSRFKKLEQTAPIETAEWAQVEQCLPEMVRTHLQTLRSTDIPAAIRSYLTGTENLYIPAADLNGFLAGLQDWWQQFAPMVKAVLISEIEDGVGEGMCLDSEGMGLIESASKMDMHDLLAWKPPSAEELAAVDAENERRIQAVQQLPDDPLDWAETYQRRLDEFSSGWRLWANVQRAIRPAPAPHAAMVICW